MSTPPKMSFHFVLFWRISGNKPLGHKVPWEVNWDVLGMTWNTLNLMVTTISWPKSSWLMCKNYSIVFPIFAPLYIFNKIYITYIKLSILRWTHQNHLHFRILSFTLFPEICVTHSAAFESRASPFKIHAMSWRVWSALVATAAASGWKDCGDDWTGCCKQDAQYHGFNMFQQLAAAFPVFPDLKEQIFVRTSSLQIQSIMLNAFRHAIKF